LWSLTRTPKDLATPLVEKDNLYYVVEYFIYITSDLNEISFRDLRKGEVWFSGVSMLGVCNVISTESLMCCYNLATERYTRRD